MSMIGSIDILVVILTKLLFFRKINNHSKNTACFQTKKSKNIGNYFQKLSNSKNITNFSEKNSN